MRHDGDIKQAFRAVKGIKNIFVGMLLIFLNFHLDIGYIRIALTPTFFGYMVMRRGLKELSAHSDWFAKTVDRVDVMVVYTAVLYLLDLPGMYYSRSAGRKMITMIRHK